MVTREYSPEFLSPAEIGRLTAVSAKTVVRAIHAGLLPARKVGRQWRVRVSDYQAWTQAHTEPEA